MKPKTYEFHCKDLERGIRKSEKHMHKPLCFLLAVCLAGISSVAAQTNKSAGSEYFVHPGVAGGALELVPITTAQALARAERVVYVQAIKNEVKRGRGGNIFTFTTFNTLQVLKGKAGAEVTVRLLGGRIDNEVIVGPLNLDFQAGDRYVLFFGKDNAESYPTLIPQALYQVKTQDGVEMVTPNPAGLPMFHAKDGRPYRGAAVNVPLNDFLYSLTQAAR
jgi:hypothetical protein